MSEIQLEDILRLSIPERLQLIEDIWDSIASNPNSLPVTDAQRRELDHRLAEYQANPQATRPWEEIRDALNRKK